MLLSKEPNTEDSLQYIERLEVELSELKARTAQERNMALAIEAINQAFTTASTVDQYFKESLNIIKLYAAAENAWLITPFSDEAKQARSYLAYGPKRGSMDIRDIEFTSLMPGTETFSSAVHGSFSSLSINTSAIGIIRRVPETLSYSVMEKIEFDTGEPLLLGLTNSKRSPTFDITDVKSFTQLAQVFKRGASVLHRLENKSLLFENSEIPMWSEDLSHLNSYLKQLRSQGVVDIETYLSNNKKEIYALLMKISITKVNSACLKLFKVDSEKDFNRISKKLSGPGAVNSFKQEIIAIWNQDESFKSIFNFVKADGEAMIVELKIQIPKGDTEFYEIPVSLIDITEQRRLDEELNESLLRYKLVVEGSYNAIWDWNVKNETVYFSQLWLDIRGYSPGEITDSQDEWIKGIHPEDLSRVMASVNAHFSGETEAFREEYRIICKDGSVKWVADRGLAQKDADGTISRMAGSEVDITERRSLNERLRLAASVYENSAEGVMILNQSGIVMDVNGAFETILGITKPEIIGSRPEIFSSEKKHRSSYSGVWAGLKNFNKWQGEIWNRHKNNSLKPSWLTISCVYDGDELTHYVGLMTDISQIKKSEEMLYQLAHHDTLTGLPNRLLLDERLDQALLQARRRKRHVAVVFIDLDNFKFVNDGMGHSVGDKLLKQVAGILSETVRADDTVARIGGDEFLLVLGDIGNPANVASVGEKLLKKINSKITLDGQDVRVSASMGVAVYPNDGGDKSTLIRNADAAMYRAKSSGKANFQFYTEELTRNAIERMSLEADLHDAIRNNELHIYYQPQVNLLTRTVTAVEALLRWFHPKLGLISPDKFIPLAEEVGLIEEIGAWVLRNSCLQFKEWQDSGLLIETLAVNISNRQLHKGNLPAVVAQALKETHLDPCHLELEITESMLLEDPDFAIKQLAEINKLGASIAIDDFGTGYSSLSYLKKLPIHKLKIDKSFIKDVPGSNNDNAITEAVIAMSERLGLDVIAEGVEMEDQEKFLLDNGCFNVQGFHYCKPVPGAELAKFVSDMK